MIAHIGGVPLEEILPSVTGAIHNLERTIGAARQGVVLEPWAERGRPKRAAPRPAWKRVSAAANTSPA